MSIIQMSDLEMDDVTFLTCRESVDGVTNKSLRGDCGPFCRNRRVCRKQHPHHVHFSFYQLFIMISSIVILLISTALLCAFANPFKTNQCHIIGTIEDTTNSTLNLTQSHLLATNGEQFPWSDLRLPNFIKPIHYDIFMHPNLTTFINRGSVEITITSEESVDFILLHGKQLNLTQISITKFNDDREPIPIIKVLENDDFELIHISLGTVLTINTEYLVKINFTKMLEERLEGFYISSYIEMSSERRKYLATTHFEPTSARSAFPCFDEPALKATFALKMVHEPIHEVYFNSEKQDTLIYSKEGLRLSVFDTTVQMSTYLVAFVVCDFKPLDARTKEGTHVRVLVPRDQINHGDLALRSAVNILTYFQSFFNITYPLTKLDLVSVPDFAAGAMENWGLMTFRATLIMYNEKTSSDSVKEEVLTVISHEIAHQWFGNLVTMKWWNDLWLNEGFASYVENLGVDHLYPEWRMLDQFVLTTTQEALALDSLQSSHPIMTDVKDPREIEAIFDTISYKKGAALIRMLKNFLGPDNLRLGLKNYLSKYKFSNAETSDLWRSFSKIVPNEVINVTSIMETWVRQKGYPVITVRSFGEHVLLTQKRYLSSPMVNEDETIDGNLSSSSSSPFGYQWIIPITLITSHNPRDPSLIWMSSTNSAIPFPHHVDWFKINVNQTGFYRVNYDEYNWKRLISLLDRSGPDTHLLSPSDRANLIDDAFSFMRMDLLQPHIALNITSYLEKSKERDYVPWVTTIINLKILDSIMEGNPLLRKFILRLLRVALKMWKQGWIDEGSHLDRKLRSSVYYAASYFGEDTTIRIAKQNFDKWFQDAYQPPPNFRKTVYTTGVRLGDIKEWEFVWTKYTKERVPSEKRLLLEAMAHTTNPWLLSQFLNYSLDRNKIKPQDTANVISHVARNPVGRHLAWHFVRSNWDSLLNLFGTGSFSIDAIISETGWHFSTQFDYDEVSNFYSKVPLGSGFQSLKQTLEKIRANIFWKQVVEPKVINWLRIVDSR
ncbi:endoplasmic reticulum aminopeptidase 1-like [Panonychus citri]|uniref:endoplasmic reticulum aminopeptidase 1-like n=1 Tax=Panonychus citri TaxID=50023 RepID=UPI0023074050|nr:endoplasmic reticulum aminopeptidase 1-like [Panonychus citri]